MVRPDTERGVEDWTGPIAPRDKTEASRTRSETVRRESGLDPELWPDLNSCHFVSRI